MRSPLLRKSLKIYLMRGLTTVLTERMVTDMIRRRFSSRDPLAGKTEKERSRIGRKSWATRRANEAARDRRDAERERDDKKER